MFNVLLCSGSLFLSSGGCSLFCRCILASLTGSTLWLYLLIGLSLSISSLLVSLLCLTLLDTLSDSSTASVENNLYAILSVVVSRDNEIDIVRIRVCINDTEYGDTQTVSLANGDILLQYIDNEECTWQTSQISDRTEVLLKLSTLTGNLEQLTL